MLANYLIGLREGLEAGLVVGILVAYLRKLGRADLLPRLALGVWIAVAVSLGTGAILTWGPYGLSFQGQEILGGGLSLVAVALVTWMIFWMGEHARALKHDLQSRLDSVIAGSGLGVILLGAISVGREGVETALFVWAAVSSSGSAIAGTAAAVLGILSASVLSWLVYRGVVRIDLSRFFTWTGVFLIVVAAGVLGYAIGDLQEAGVIPGVGQAAYSLAGIVSPTSWYGTLLSGVFNFTAEPTWAQVAGWTLYLAVVLPVFLVRVRTRGRVARSAPPAAGTASSAA